MKYKLLGSTGLRVSELCLGTMTFGGKGWAKMIGSLDQQTVDQVVKKSIDAGINFIDTANVYSEGLAEELTGQAIKNLGLNRDDLVIATKVRGQMGQGPNDSGLTRKHILRQVEASLKRLATDYIDLYQIHSFDPLTPWQETLWVLDDLVKSGKVRYIGASNLAAWQLMKALDFANYTRVAAFVSLQAYYTIAGRDLEREVIPLLKDQQLGLLVWSPLAGGLLSGKYKREDVMGKAGGQGSSGQGGPGQGSSGTAGRRTGFDFPPVDKGRAFDILDVLRPMAQSKGVSVAQLALAWLLRQPAVTSVIIGANKMEQLEDNLASINVVFSTEDLQRLDEVSKLPPEYPGWMLDWTGQDRQA